MKVKDLIRHLKQWDSNAEVQFYNPYCNNCGYTNSDKCSDGDGNSYHFLQLDYIDGDVVGDGKGNDKYIDLILK